MFNCCTLFNTGFLTRGLTLYRSLEQHCSKFCLYVFAFDDFTANYLRGLSLPSLRVISLAEFEDPELLRVKPTRSRGEYCWTCASSTILYVIENFGVPACTYLDADMQFYGDPQLIEKSLSDYSIGITPHRYATDAKRASREAHGIYCVQYVTIRNNTAGLTALRWWREKCLEWCYARLEDGRFGDQKYLDDWPQRFQGVRVIEEPGAGLAPWNASRYELSGSSAGGFSIREKMQHNEAPLFFYHFHALRFYSRERINLVGGGYHLPTFLVENLYKPYVRAQIEMARQIQKQYPETDPLGVSTPVWWKHWGTHFYSCLNSAYSCHYTTLDKFIP